LKQKSPYYRSSHGASASWFLLPALQRTQHRLRFCQGLLNTLLKHRHQLDDLGRLLLFGGDRRFFAAIPRERRSGIELGGLFPNHFVCVLVFPESEKDRLTEPIIERPLGEFYLTDH
jgi:hypothetical protein